MIRTLYSSMFCGISIVDNSNGQAFIVDDDMKVLKTYDYDDFRFQPVDIVSDYIKTIFKNYTGIMKSFRDATIKQFLESDYYNQFKEYQNGRYY